MADDPAGAQDIYVEILGQAEHGAATLLSRELGEVKCEAGALEDVCSATVSHAWDLKVSFGDNTLPPILFVVDASKLDFSAANQVKPLPTAKDSNTSSHSSTVGQLLGLELPLSVVLGRIPMKIQQVLKLTSGSVVELDRTVSDHVEVLVQGKLIAKGEVVSVRGNYGVRITELVASGAGLAGIDGR